MDLLVTEAWLSNQELLGDEVEVAGGSQAARQHEAAQTFAAAAETAGSTRELQADFLPIFTSVVKPRVQIF